MLDNGIKKYHIRKLLYLFTRLHYFPHHGLSSYPGTYTKDNRMEYLATQLYRSIPYVLNRSKCLSNLSPGELRYI